jgi:hypothetical protein
VNTTTNDTTSTTTTNDTTSTTTTREELVRINLEGEHWSGEYVARMWQVRIGLGRSAKGRAADAAAYWPEIWRHVDARKQFRRFPAFVQAVILNQK